MIRDKEYLGELFLIVGGFIFAETIIRQFLDMANGTLPWWTLPLMALSLISGGLELKKREKLSIYGWIYWGWLFLSIILIVLMKKEIITTINFLWAILVISIFQIVISLIYVFKSKKS